MKIQLGTIPSDPDNLPPARDAVHVAAVLVRADEKLIPGIPITIRDGLATPCHYSVADAVCDPFLQHPVGSGQYFYALIAPDKVKNLRHTFDLDFDTEKPAEEPEAFEDGCRDCTF